MKSEARMKTDKTGKKYIKSRSFESIYPPPKIVLFYHEKNHNIARLLLIPSFLLYPLGNNYSYYDDIKKASSHHQKNCNCASSRIKKCLNSYSLLFYEITKFWGFKKLKED